jgi:hypothetical protein
VPSKIYAHFFFDGLVDIQGLRSLRVADKAGVVRPRWWCSSKFEGDYDVK